MINSWNAQQLRAVSRYDALHQVGRVDSTLTFGVPLAAFSLQYVLVRDMAWGPAWAERHGDLSAASGGSESMNESVSRA